MLFLSLLVTASAASATPMPQSVAVAIAKDIGHSEKGTVLCLSIDGRDPTQQTLSKISAHAKGYVPSSSCGVKDGSLRHRATNKVGISMSFSNFKMKRDGHATVRVSSYAGPLAGGVWTTNLKLADGVWSVESTKNDVIY